MVLRISKAFDAIDFGVFLLTVDLDSYRNLVFCLIGEVLLTNFFFICQTWHTSIQIIRFLDYILQIQF